MSLKSTDPFSIYKNVDEIPKKQWEAVTATQSIFLQFPYLRALAHALSDTILFYYILVNDSQGNPILAGLFQQTSFTYKKGADKNILLKLFKDCKNEDDSVSINGLVCGNIFATGIHGFAHTNAISLRAATELMASAAQLIDKEYKSNEHFSVQLFKDFSASETKASYILEEFKYRPFQADVTMELAIDAGWTDFDSYLKSMKAKYRTKAKSALNKSAKVRYINLSAAEIKEHETQLQQLFNNVQDKSDYSYGEDYPRAFMTLKQQLKDQFICKAAFLDDTIIGFSTAFVNNNTLEASYIGIDYTYNLSHALYECFLYAYVEDAIKNKARHLSLGRTSELIKSALGAEPKQMTLYIKHTSSIKNVLLKPLVDNIGPSDFDLRRPFKSKFYTS